MKLGKPSLTKTLALGLLSSLSFFSTQAYANTRINGNLVADSFESDIFAMKLMEAALERLSHKITYDGRYIQIPYPWGDVPNNIGVCTDVVVRSYRKLGIDLQQRVHKDMLKSFREYPNLPKWERNAPDANIDHRRVLNLRVFFARNGHALPISNNPKNYRPGDMVTWDIQPGVPHIGVVTNKISEDAMRPMIVHNIGKGPKLEDILFRMNITGHYRYQPMH